MGVHHYKKLRQQIRVGKNVASKPICLRARAARGFTLLELVIVVAIVAILAIVAYPAYLTQMRIGRRSDAVQAAAPITQAQERWRSNNAAYGQLTDLQINATSTGGYYGLAIASATSAGYTLTATPKTTGTQNADSACNPMTVTVSSGVAAYTPSTCWGQR